MNKLALVRELSDTRPEPLVKDREEAALLVMRDAECDGVSDRRVEDGEAADGGERKAVKKTFLFLKFQEKR